MLRKVQLAGAIGNLLAMVVALLVYNATGNHLLLFSAGMNFVFTQWCFIDWLKSS